MIPDFPHKIGPIENFFCCLLTLLSFCPVGWLSIAELANRNFWLGQSYYVMRKVWYHQIWIQNNLDFIVSDLIKIAEFCQLQILGNTLYYLQLKSIKLSQYRRFIWYPSMPTIMYFLAIPFWHFLCLMIHLMWMRTRNFLKWCTFSQKFLKHQNFLHAWVFLQ